MEKLAINGGTPARTAPNPPMFPGGMELGEEEKQALMEVIDCKRLFRYYGPNDTQSKVTEFEQKFAQRMDSKYTLATSSCTGALITALIAAGVGPGDEVIVPAYTFIASAAAILGANAIPVITEVDDTLTLDPKAVETNITPSTKAILPVHMRGIPSQMDELMAIAKKHNLILIEDAAQALGGSYKGKSLGTIGNAGCFSFQYHKIITTGEGGMITTSDYNLLERAQMYHDSGGLWRPKLWQGVGENYMPIPGTNYRMSELAGAVGVVQLTRLDGLLDKMKSYKARIKDALRDIPGIQLRRVPDELGDTGIALMFFLPDRETTSKFGEAIQAEGINAGTMYDKDIPDWHVYLHWKHILNQYTANSKGCPFTCPYHKEKIEYSDDMCPQTLDLLRRSVHFDISPMYTDEDIDQIIEAFLKVSKALL